MSISDVDAPQPTDIPINLERYVGGKLDSVAYKGRFGLLLRHRPDRVSGAGRLLVYYIALKNAGVPGKIHLYPEGKHAFGLRLTKFPITRWPQFVETWLRR
jgi:hypothetical protein